MIFKVSFKETEKSPSKVVQKVGKTTTVILRGVVELPAFWKHLPEEIIKWIEGRQKVEGYENLADNTLIIYSTGVSKCNPDDKYDSLLGERLAEARAKYHIYKFFYDLTSKLYDYYNRILFGDAGIVDSGHCSCLAQDVKKYEGLCIRESHHIGELLASKDNG
jgi:hypothetical protein